jgi:TorA maturation chaperone TorD
MQVGPEQPTIDEVDALRAQQYRFLARLLGDAPDSGALAALAGIEGDRTEFGQALATLAKVAAATAPAEASREFDELFVGVGRGELVPYASFYRTGFLNGRPLAELRADLAALGIARAPDNPDPEDHIAALCDVMAGLIDGSLGAAGLNAQRRFFDRHLAPWAEQFFTDLERARASRLYAPVGTLGRLFMTIETTGFEMAA